MKSQRILRSEGEAFFTVIIGHWIWLITDFHYGNVTENDKMIAYEGVGPLFCPSCTR